MRTWRCGGRIAPRRSSTLLYRVLKARRRNPLGSIRGDDEKEELIRLLRSGQSRGTATGRWGEFAGDANRIGRKSAKMWRWWYQNYRLEAASRGLR